MIPESYTGNEVCYYQFGSQSHNENDAIQAAVYNLLRQLDFDLNNKLDVKIEEQNLRIESTEIVGIPYTWSTEVQVRRWD